MKTLAAALLLALSLPSVGIAALAEPASPPRPGAVGLAALQRGDDDKDDDDKDDDEEDEEEVRGAGRVA